MKYYRALIVALLAFSVCSEKPVLGATISGSSDCSTPVDPAQPAEANKEIARCFFTSVVNERNVELIDKVMDPDKFIDNLYAEPTQGTDLFKAGVDMYLNAFADLQVNIQDLVAEDDKVVLRFSLVGTHTGQELYGIQPNGNPVDVPAITIIRFDNGRIVERWLREDTQTLIDQLSATNAGQSQQAPEPTSGFGVLAFGALGTGWMLRSKLKQKAVRQAG